MNTINKLFFLILIFILSTGNLLAQNLTGTWVGTTHLKNSPKVKVQTITEIVHEGNKISATMTQIQLTTDGNYGRVDAVIEYMGYFDGTYFVFKCTNVISYDSPSGGICLSESKTKYHIRGGKELLIGQARSTGEYYKKGKVSKKRKCKGMTAYGQSEKQTVDMSKIPDEVGVIIPQNEEEVSIDKVSDVSNDISPEYGDRSVEIVKVIETNENKVVLSLWDSLKEDGDIISVLINDDWLLKDYEIKNRPKKIDIQLKKGDNFIVVNAENLGSIEPNTCRALIKDVQGKTLTELDFTSDLKKSQVIRIIVN